MVDSLVMVIVRRENNINSPLVERPMKHLRIVEKAPRGMR